MRHPCSTTSSTSSSGYAPQDRADAARFHADLHMLMRRIHADAQAPYMRHLGGAGRGDAAAVPRESKRMRLVGVLTATQHEYDEWLQRWPEMRERSRRLCDLQHCQGLELSEIVRVGAWWRMDNAREVENYAATRLR